MSNYCFPVFKGLQRPLEFMGIRGRFITLAAVAIGVSFLSFLLFSSLFGQLTGFIIAFAFALFFLILIYIKQRQGLHAKKKFRGLLIYHHLFNH